MSADALARVALACPIDGLALVRSAGTFACADGHAYDVSRHGYLNLLPVQFKPSRDPGDSAVMVAARRRVLEAGLYDPLADAVADEVSACIDILRSSDGGRYDDPSGGPDDGPDETTAPREGMLVVDAGCGEGHYTARLAARLHARANGRGGGARVLGVDISVHAVKAAARRHRDIAWAVANNTHLPVLAGGLDVITSLFGFETWAPWAARQLGGQCVVVAHAGPRHLLEIREAIYAEVHVHDAPRESDALAAGYVLEHERGVTFALHGMTADRLDDVVSMTPHRYRAPAGASRALAALAGEAGPSGPAVTVDVVLRRYRRVRVRADLPVV